MNFIILCLFLCISTASFATSTIDIDPKPTPPPKGLLPSGLIHLGQGHFQPRVAIVADKERRTLSVWKNSKGLPKLVSYHAMDFGKKEGNKFKRGDLKTPEGIYFVQDKKEANELDFNEYGIMAFTLDYPNYFDKRDKKSGSGIWLHSIPPEKTLKRGSRGCLVLRESNIKVINKYIRLDRRTPIIIYNKAEYITPEQLKLQKAKYVLWLKKWKKNWQEKNNNKYIANYSKKFFGSGKDFLQWKTYKAQISENNAAIKVNIKEPVIYKNKDQVIVRFSQDYASDSTKDTGEKTLHIKIENKSPKIISESWLEQKKEILGTLKL